MKVLGVNCSSQCAFVAVASEGELVNGHVEYVDAPMLADSLQELASVLEELGRVLREVRADRLILLKPEAGPTPKKTHAAFVSRIALGTLVRLAAVRTDTEIEVLARPTLRSRLNLPTSGELVAHVPRRVPRKVGVEPERRAAVGSARCARGSGTPVMPLRGEAERKTYRIERRIAGGPATDDV